MLLNKLQTACLAMVLGAPFLCPAQAQEVWRFDQTATVSGHATKVLGHPRVIDTEIGKAVAFNGVDDALFFDLHPLHENERSIFLFPQSGHSYR